MKKGFLYKRCGLCGTVWNVSALAGQTGKRYICPDCALRRRRRRKARYGRARC